MKTQPISDWHGGRRQPARGMGSVAVVVVLVGLAALAAAMAQLGRASQDTLAQDVLASRASAAARAGLEWGLYQAFKGAWIVCSGASQTLDLVADTGMRVTVSCDSALYNEGEASPGVAQTVRVYTLDAVACNGSANCPDAGAAVRPGYAERRRQISATN